MIGAQTSTGLVYDMSVCVDTGSKANCSVLSRVESSISGLLRHRRRACSPEPRHCRDPRPRHPNFPNGNRGGRKKEGKNTNNWERFWLEKKLRTEPSDVGDVM